MPDNANQDSKHNKPRRLSGLIIILLAFVVLAILNYRPSIERIHCNEEILDSQPEVIMLSTWWCSYCYQARRYLTNNNISYCEYDIERSAEGEKLFNDLNAQAIPVLLVDKYIINGFDEARLESLLSRVREES
ncbi:MAG: hypothetical protein KJO91_04155 [Gammaproteobacteria bacterium]|jgi:glutaredoxin|nr:hypothetical protein [Gammaproteobacteria bacterium]